jgi:hypothetical protein
MSEAPKKPSDLALWIAKNGDPDQIKVDYRQIGCDEAETYVILTVTSSGKSIEVHERELRDESYADCEAHIKLSHCSIVELTDLGQKRVTEWEKFVRVNARDLREYRRLQKKFGGTVP